jgi:hypothetical protein
VYLAVAREHPPAAVVRQQQQDYAVFVKALADFNRRQAQLFLAINAVIARYEPPELQVVADGDVIDAAAALAATHETAARGVIYEHPATTPAGERLGAAIRALLREVEEGSGGSAFARDVAVVLRRIEQTARAAHASGGGDSRAYFKLLDRILSRREEPSEAGGESDAPRLILP